MTVDPDSETDNDAVAHTETGTERSDGATQDDAAQPTLTQTVPVPHSGGNQLWQRPNVVVIRLPGVDDHSQRLSQGAGNSLAGVIDAILDKRNVSQIEVLTVPLETALVYILSIDVTSTDRERLDRSGQQPIDMIQERDSTTPTSKLDLLVEELEETLNDTIGIETGHADLSPINPMPVIGTRLLLETNRSLANSDYGECLHGGLLQRLVDTKKPFVTQTIVSQKSQNKYLLTMRYAVLHPDHMLGPSADKAQHLRNGREFDLSTHINDCGVVTNHDLPMSDFARPIYDEVKLKVRKYMERSDSRTALDLYCGTSEFRDLLRGRPGADQLYDDLGLHGRIPVPQTELKHVGTVCPRYYFDNPWDKVPHRHPPRILTNEICRPAAGTDQSIGIHLDATPDSAMSASTHQQGSDADPVTKGGAQHKTLVPFVIAFYETLGHEVWEHEQGSGESVPDVIVVRDGERYHYEVEDSNETKPGNILTNYGRAVYNNVPVVFVVRSESLAENVREMLLEPHKGTADDSQPEVRDGAVNPYTLSGHGLTLANGAQPLLPREESESRWWLAGEIIRLRTEEGRVLAEGPADAPFSEIEWYTPRYEKFDGDHRVVDSDGNLIEEAATKKAVLTNWTKVQAPFIPPNLHCLTDAEVMYQSGDELESLSSMADWGAVTDGKTAVYNDGMDKFVEHFIVEEEGSSIPYDEFQAKAREFFETRAEVVPTNTYIGRALPDHVDVDPKQVSDREVHDVRWVYEPGLHSPGHPYIDSDDLDDDDARAVEECDDDGAEDTADGDTPESGDTHEPEQEEDSA